jgi:hypothetical protein
MSLKDAIKRKAALLEQRELEKEAIIGMVGRGVKAVAGKMPAVSSAGRMNKAIRAMNKPPAVPKPKSESIVSRVMDRMPAITSTGKMNKAIRAINKKPPGVKPGASTPKPPPPSANAPAPTPSGAPAPPASPAAANKSSWKNTAMLVGGGAVGGAALMSGGKQATQSYRNPYSPQGY